jgi:hypothetical protein
MDGGHGDSSSLDSGSSGYPAQKKIDLSHLNPEQLKAYEAREAKEDKKHTAFLLIGAAVVASLWAHHTMTTYSVNSAQDVQSCINRTYDDNFGAQSSADFAERKECQEITGYVIGSMSNPPSLDDGKLSVQDKAKVMDKIGQLREKAMHVLESGHKEVWAKP